MNERIKTFWEYCDFHGYTFKVIAPYQYRAILNGRNILDFYPKSLKMFDMHTKKYITLNNNWNNPNTKKVRIWEVEIEKVLIREKS